MTESDSTLTPLPFSFDDFQQGWLTGWLAANGWGPDASEAQFAEATRAWQSWLARSE